ncbi:TDT family transporter [Demequina capsici]|uniref:TDT family transporter n=1 Tax=Demequina capsici TaxID=3075620 RepID=A0AA96J958_9MICO|nr:TDT family transporter [Demequina sp. OYTSA14]WNM25663.1 TDT family transporter [Demequina sp. OYTSA14]
MSPRTPAPAVTPNWFAVVMGTSILATAAATLPVSSPVLTGIAWTAWALASVVLLAAVATTTRHYLDDRGAIRRYLDDPGMAHFYGAQAMGLLAYGAATLVVAKPLLGQGVAVGADATLWILGTALGLATAVGVPVLAFTRHSVAPGAASGAWLMPVVPPMVSAATGAMLLPYVGGELSRTLALACYAMFGLSGLAAIMVIASVWNRLAHHQVGAAAAVPTLWIVLGPLGQSVTAVGLLADHAAQPLGIDSHALLVFSLLYGVPVMGFALMWLAIALAVTVRTARVGLPFTLAWWAFTFPVGTCVTGASQLAKHTGSAAMTGLAVLLYALLAAGWGVAATGTLRHYLPRRERAHALSVSA